MKHDLSRRNFLGKAAMTLAATQFSTLTTMAATAQKTSAGTSHTKSPTDQAENKQNKQARPDLGPIKQIDAGLLNIGYSETGNGPAVILLHGWPYDIYSYGEVAPILAAKGYRVIIPYLRGYGTTRFLSDSTVRNAQQSVVALDIINLMDALKIEKAVIGGFDWGSRTAGIMGVLWPERCKALVLVSGYLLTNLAANKKPLPPQAEYGWWYQYYFATERGRIGYSENRKAFSKLIWKQASPRWNFDDATFDRSAAAFDNPDHVDIVIHNYRWRLSLAQGEAQYDDYEKKLNTFPPISLPTITVSSDFDGPNKDGKAYAKQFTGKYDHRIFDGIGHNVPQEAPKAFADAIIAAGDFDVPRKK